MHTNEWVHERDGGNSNSNRASAIGSTGAEVPTIVTTAAGMVAVLVTARTAMVVTVGTAAGVVGVGDAYYAALSSLLFFFSFLLQLLIIFT